MASKLALRSRPFSFSIFTANHFLRSSFRPLLSAFSSTSFTISSGRDCTYGPCLSKGRKPLQSPQPHNNGYASSESQEEEEEEEEEEETSAIDRERFTRVFDIAAIRVPAKDCFEIEKRLRGHLLNWPRIRNIARVPGDEMEEEFKKLIRVESDNEQGDEGENLDALSRRIYGRADGDGETLSPVLYRDKLARTFNSRGFVRFRNLAKISRPTKKKKKKVKEGELSERGKRIGKDEFAVVEVVECGDEEKEDLSGLLGDEFRGGRWRGSTRLLLLDERYASRSAEELPEVVKVLLRGDSGQSRRTTCELVQCKLTLFYNYWQMNEILEASLPNDIIVPAAFETVGHIAHLNLRDEHLPYKKLIAQVVLDKNRPKIKTVVNKIDAIQNDYRTMELEVLAGNHSLVTIVVENGLRFHVDLAKVYWNSRLATERQRLVSHFTSKDILCDVFAGVGPIALAAAKKVKRVYANDLNPSAVDYLERNCILNKIERKIKVFNMDGRRFINAIFVNQKADTITQVVMNLPRDAVEYLDVFRGIYRRKPKEMMGQMPMIHVYGFSKAKDPEFDFHQRIRTVLLEFAVEVEIHRVRLVAPGKWMLCASFILPRSVAFATQA